MDTQNRLLVDRAFAKAYRNPSGIKTMLTLDRMRNGRIIERRRGWSRSFTKGLIELLYIQFAHILASGPYSAMTLFGTQNLGGEYAISNLQAAVGGGDAQSLHSCYINQNPVPIPNNVVGIIVGNDNTAVTPTDSKLGKIYQHGQGAAVGAGTKFDYYETDTTDGSQIYGTNNISYGPSYYGLWFTRGMRVSKVGMYIKRVSTPGTCYMGLGVLDRMSNTVIQLSETSFDGNAIGTSPAWTEVTLPAEVDCYPNFPYCVYVRAPSGTSGGAYLIARYNNAVVQPRSANGIVSTYLFRFYGSALVELVHSGTEVRNFVANSGAGTVAFDIVRYFLNLSGAAASIQEVSLVAIGMLLSGDSASAVHYARHCLTSRDIISPAQALNNTELLKVTLTPQITV